MSDDAVCSPSLWRGPVLFFPESDSIDVVGCLIMAGIYLSQRSRCHLAPSLVVDCKGLWVAMTGS